MCQNASKYGIFNQKIRKIFWGGAQPTPHIFPPMCRGIPLPTPHLPRRLWHLAPPILKSWVRHCRVLNPDAFVSEEMHSAALQAATTECTVAGYYTFGAATSALYDQRHSESVDGFEPTNVERRQNAVHIWLRSHRQLEAVSQVQQ